MPAAAEHFLAHGDYLMQAVRTVFNIAIGADSPDIQNTARSALLQMVNTVLKRVGQQVMVSAELNAAAVASVCCGARAAGVCAVKCESSQANQDRAAAATCVGADGLLAAL